LTPSWGSIIRFIFVVFSAGGGSQFVTPFHGVRLRRPAGPQMMVFAGSDRGSERAAPAEYLQELVADHKSSTRVFAGSEESVAIISPWASTNCCCRATTISHFGGSAAPAATFFYSRDRAGKHPERLRRRLRGIQHSLQPGATAGFDHRSRMLGACQTKAVRACRRHREGRATKTSALISPIAFMAVQTIDASSWWSARSYGAWPEERLAERRTGYAARR
jgi:hypothetical protein